MLRKSHGKFAKILIIFFIFILGYINLSVTRAQSGLFVYSNQVLSVSEYANNNNVWTKDQWVYYKTTVSIEETLIVNMTYSGDLDLDMRLYVDEDKIKKPSEQTNFAHDITHCGLPTQAPARNSQVRGTSNVLEEVSYKNYDAVQPRVVYILIFAYSGVGNSTFELRSNLELTKVETGFTSCFGVNESKMVFGVVLIITLIGFYVLSKREKKVDEMDQKIGGKIEKLQKQGVKVKKVSKKKKKKDKSKISMSQRVSKSRR